jgi:pimeloyl-ACP methyl ester carboxylesterase
VLIVAALAVVIVCLAALAVYAGQELLIFAPVRLPAGYRFGWPEVTERTIDVDGASLSALHLQLPDPKGLAFLLHGNAGHLADWFAGYELFRDANFDLFMIDYRGYGKSSGRVRSEAQLHADVAAAWRAVAPAYRGRRRVIMGRSLGTALAARLAAGLPADERADLVMLASPFWSLVELARLHYPLVPTFLMRYRLETHRDVERLDAPVLLLHGDRDTLIPLSHSQRLLSVARRAQLLTIHGAAHGDLQHFPEYLNAIARQLVELP